MRKWMSPVHELPKKSLTVWFSMMMGSSMPGIEAGVGVGRMGVGVGGKGVDVGGMGVDIGGMDVGVGGMDVGVETSRVMEHATKNNMTNAKPVICSNNLLRFIMSSSV